MPANPAASFDTEADDHNNFTSSKLARMGVGTDTVMVPARSEPHLLRKLFAEFLGDTLFVFIGSLSATDGMDTTGAAFAHGITIAVLIMSLGHISGGHFNPCVTLGIALTGNIKPITALMYAAAQLLGGCFGALLVRAVLKDLTYSIILGGATTVPISGPTFGGFALPAGQGGTFWWQAIICELMLTYILVQSVLMTAVDTNTNLLAPLAIGLTLTLDIFGAAHISSSSMNPARSFGPCVMASIFANSTVIESMSDYQYLGSTSAASFIWRDHYVYWVGPILGATLAAATYRLLLAKDDKRILL